MLMKTKLAMALSLAWTVAPTGTMAQQPPPTDIGVSRLNEVTVSSTRSERRIDTVPNTVTVTPASKIEEEGARDIKDVFRNELDVSVTAGPTRFTAAGAATGRGGNEGINIRGLQGNQVLMTVDGIRVPNSFSFGAFATGRGDFLDIDGIKTVEVLRGPASTQFGSDGLAGAVIFRTLDPLDLLKKGQSVGGFVRSNYASIDSSWSNSVGAAGANTQWQGMLLGSFRNGAEIGNRGDNAALNSSRTQPNPVDYNNRYLLGKAFLNVNTSHQIGLAFESQNRRQNTEVYSARAIAPLVATSTLDLDTQDRIDRRRVSVEHRYKDLNGTFAQKAETRLYWQDSKVSQLSLEDRNTAADRIRNNSFDTKVFGLSSLLETNLTGVVQQRVTYGVDWSRSNIAGLRDGTVPPPGEVFPTKPFPDTSYTLAGGFVQSEIEAGKFSVIPGLRFDHYSLTPSQSGYVGGQVTRLSGQAVTPRLGAVWQLMPSFAPYAQIAKGYRAPTPDQVNNGFTNIASGYQSVGNPNLRAENALSIELGFRGNLDGFRYSMAAFNNSYKDFISQRAVSGAGTVVNPTIFQFVNLTDARIHGLEARGEWQLSKLWKLNAGIAYAKGDSVISGVKTPLDTVQPVRIVLGARYDTDQWGARANLQHSQGKDSSRISTGATQFAPPSYTVLDMGVYWKPARNLTLHANLNNVLNSKYWRWSDVSGLSATSTARDAYTAPGRNAQVSARYDF